MENQNGRRLFVSASELAEMGACERRVFFEAKYGKRRSRDQEKAEKRGRVGHRRFFRDAFRVDRNVKTSLAKPWCFCASLAWGEHAPETQLLRAFRDEMLRPMAIGRWLVNRYYKFSPGVCAAIRGKPALIAVLRFSLTPAVLLARIALSSHRRRRIP